jgi:branched-chain amino acid transport system substrate-binding protein
MSMRRMLLASVAAAAVVSLTVPESYAQNEQFLAMVSYRVGPYAAGGSGIYGGYEDYLQLVNIRDGGINGVKITWEECETEYNPDRGVECYERLKNHPPTGGTVIQPLSTGITYRLIERATADKIPIISLAYGRTDATDGRIFPYVFPLITNYWSQNTTKIKFIAMKEGGFDKLKGKKIANVYHESSYGKETIPILDKQAEIYGFEVRHYAVPHPGQEQKSIWLDLARRYQPDWVILRGWGAMNPTALQEAARIDFPRERIVGVWWSGAEEDVIPAKDAAKGYISTAFTPSGTDFPVIQDIIKYVQDAGKGNVDRKRVGTIYYNRGVIHGIITAEAIRAAQGKFGNRPITGEEMRWGIESLRITAERLKELGAEGLMQPLTITCADHEGGGAVKFQQWDGEKWVIITDWIEADRDLVRPLIEESAAKYAKEKGIVPREGMSLGVDCGTYPDDLKKLVQG